MSDLPEKARAAEAAVIRSLPSGRTVSVRSGGGHEEIEIRSAGGEMEVRIALTPQGPVLQLRGARLEIDSTDTVAVNCRKFEVTAADGVKIDAAGDIEVAGSGELRMKSAGQTFIDGDYVNLNCRDRTGYHDDPAKQPPAIQQQPSAPAGDGSASSGSCGCADH